MPPLARKTASSLARAVHIKVSPAPKSLTESRQILRAIQNFGDVSMFKNLRYEKASSTIIALFRKEESAQQLLNQSPIAFTVERPRGAPKTSAAARLESEKSLREQLEAEAGVALPDEPLTSPDEHLLSYSSVNQRKFRLLIDVATLDFERDIRRQPYSGKYDIKKTMIQKDLAKTVPFAGLSDISFENLRPERLKRQDVEEIEAMPTLHKMWQDGMDKASLRGDKAENNSPLQTSHTGMKEPQIDVNQTSIFSEPAQRTMDIPQQAGLGPGGKSGNWGLKTSIQTVVENVGKMIAGEQEEEKPRKYGPP